MKLFYSIKLKSYKYSMEMLSQILQLVHCQTYLLTSNTSFFVINGSYSALIKELTKISRLALFLLDKMNVTLKSLEGCLTQSKSFGIIVYKS